MPRTTTRNNSTVSVPGWVDISFTPELNSSLSPTTTVPPSPPPSPSLSHAITVTFHPSPSPTGTGLHWHETHTEYLQVLHGFALITTGTHTAVFTAGSGVLTIPLYTVHQVQRADDTPEGKHHKDEELVIREWTDPADRDKEVFFRNLLGVVGDKGGVPVFGVLEMVVSRAHDNFPVFWSGPGFLGDRVKGMVMRGVTYGVMGILGLLGGLFGWKGDYEE